MQKPCGCSMLTPRGRSFSTLISKSTLSALFSDNGARSYPFSLLSSHMKLTLVSKRQWRASAAERALLPGFMVFSLLWLPWLGCQLQSCRKSCVFVLQQLFVASPSVSCLLVFPPDALTGNSSCLPVTAWDPSSPSSARGVWSWSVPGQSSEPVSREVVCSHIIFNDIWIPSSESRSGFSDLCFNSRIFFVIFFN